ncbi:hypothetical protein [Chitinophaga pinensis]|uniref:Uncharacterized protein n=1 Tax=Chitinophaga pinensis (strain ATCC 43595 / DSM 2588 / LMG 13176 / NBRC 15968 / NCIMB 11800 / UQM 2034) TaxID=485918 RepID=A0A979G7W8_CHIPD|nr:hypothetical protein [Chitinophaga pinensis]ACU62267.1 hypothetical protein Cpin_4833 [Chitinophaga pinensis DSM 2588]
MNIYKSIRGLLLVGLAIVLFSACGKEDPIVDMGYLPPATLPDSVTVTYGTVKTLNLPDEYKSQPYVNFRLDFTGNTNLKVNTSDSLHTLLAKAIVVDAKEKHIRIDAGKLYPNSNRSELTGVRLPDTYKVRLVAESLTGLKPVRADFTLKVMPAALGIKELSATDPIPYGYSLYSAEGASYTIDYLGLDKAGTNLELHQNGFPDGHVTLQGDKVVLDQYAGDEDRKYEWTYDLVANLQKDGYRVAYKQFRTVILPQPKFIYGIYYPEFDLTIVQNRVVMGLGNAYMSPAPVFNPEKYKGSFRILSIAYGSAPFADTDKLFSVDASTGQVRAAANSSLSAGEYKMTVEVTTTIGIKLTTTFTLVME